MHAAPAPPLQIVAPALHVPCRLEAPEECAGRAVSCRPVARAAARRVARAAARRAARAAASRRLERAVQVALPPPDVPSTGKSARRRATVAAAFRARAGVAESSTYLGDRREECVGHGQGGDGLHVALPRPALVQHKKPGAHLPQYFASQTAEASQSGPRQPTDSRQAFGLSLALAASL